MTDSLINLSFDELVRRVRACQICAGDLPHEPRPVIQLSESSRILVVGQAPGRRVHETGLPFNDPSGDRLRQCPGPRWLVYGWREPKRRGAPAE